MNTSLHTSIAPMNNTRLKTSDFQNDVYKQRKASKKALKQTRNSARYNKRLVKSL